MVLSSLRDSQTGLEWIEEPGAEAPGYFLVSLRDTSSCPVGASDSSPVIYGRVKETTIISLL